MENNEEKICNSSDSENSEWAVIDEDHSLEWNDEAKYHFRHSPNAVDKNRVGDSVDFSGTDEDSIEVVSNIANDDHDTDYLEINDSMDHNKEANDQNEMPSATPLQDATEMVWYRVGQRKNAKKERKSYLQSKPNTKNTNALNLSDNWDLVAILIVALIGGFAFGYFCGFRQSDDKPSDFSNDKLQQENEVLRNSLYHANACIRFPSTCTVTSEEVMRSDIDILPLKSIESESNSKPETLPIVENLITTHGTNGIKNEVTSANGLKGMEDVNKASTNSPHPLPAKTDMDERKENDFKKEMPETSNLDNIYDYRHALKEGIDKISRFPIGDGLTQSLEDLRKVDFSLQILDLIDYKTMPLTNFNKITTYRSEIQKSSKKLTQKINKSMNKFANRLRNKLEESNTDLVKNLCKQWAIIDRENLDKSKWSVGTVFEACNHSKHSLKEAKHQPQITVPTMEQIKKTASVNKEELVTSGKVCTPENGPGHPKPIHSKTKLSKYKKKTSKDSAKNIGTLPSEEEEFQGKKVKNVRTNYKKAEMKGSNSKKQTNFVTESTKPKFNDESKKRSANNNDEAYCVGKIGCKEKVVNEKDYSGEGNYFCNSTPKTSDEMVKSNTKVSNISGDWILKMGNSRAEQRHQDQQTNWFFKRAESRKCHRQHKDCKASLYTTYFPSEHQAKPVASNYAQSERKHWLKNALPKSFVEAAKTVKYAFKQYHHNLKQKMRY